eukprot:3120669-Rhodomonas_salina.2
MPIHFSPHGRIDAFDFDRPHTLYGSGGLMPLISQAMMEMQTGGPAAMAKYATPSPYELAMLCPVLI